MAGETQVEIGRRNVRRLTVVLQTLTQVVQASRASQSEEYKVLLRLDYEVLKAWAIGVVKDLFAPVDASVKPLTDVECLTFEAVTVGELDARLGALARRLDRYLEVLGEPDDVALTTGQKTAARQQLTRLAADLRGELEKLP